MIIFINKNFSLPLKNPYLLQDDRQAMIEIDFWFFSIAPRRSSANERNWSEVFANNFAQ